MGATTVAISTTTGLDGEYAIAIANAGAIPRILRFDIGGLDAQLADVHGVVLCGGGDVDPQLYGSGSDLAAEIDAERDEFEIALARLARARRLPTLCICRGLQIANVAFGGTLIPDIGSFHGDTAAALHRIERIGESVRGLIDGHEVDIEPESLLARVVGTSALATSSRHHQSLGQVAADLRVVATTHDGIIEAAEARFDSPFWLGVQWHPESTVELDRGASRAIFHAFVDAAGKFPSTRSFE